ncbi:histidine-tRNA ligase [Medicago truncatula]|uniref:Histidine-tRNA ligase n=1 Tax=Medicago truncatula TaxID=3880 RepID=G7K3E4_MEDTR|nr:histidine-tRNA ligase [Medicago truncatula]
MQTLRHWLLNYCVEEKGLSAETADRIGTFVKEKGHPLTVLSKLKQDSSPFLENAGSVDALNDLEILFKALDNSNRLDKVVFDLSLARGLDYYTGVIFEAVFKGGAQVGSIAAGGRYDNLIGMFISLKILSFLAFHNTQMVVFQIIHQPLNLFLFHPLLLQPSQWTKRFGGIRK